MKIGNLEVYGIIYKIENLVNGRVYIGQTTNKNGFDGRYNNDLYNRTHNKHLKYSINKYGLDNFNINKVLDIAFSQKELDIKEKCWIRIYDSINNGYNIASGGGNRNSFAGKSKEEMNIIGNKIRSKTMCHTVSKVTREKISRANKGKHRTKETIDKLSKAKEGKNNPKSKKLICITTNKIFDTLVEAGIFYNCCNKSIGKCCRQSQKYSGNLDDGTKEEYIKYDIENKLKEMI